ncbi:hypothetical protein LguiB_002877 [Lonicera macranthoides]
MEMAESVFLLGLADSIAATGYVAATVNAFFFWLARICSCHYESDVYVRGRKFGRDKWVVNRRRE